MTLINRERATMPELPSEPTLPETNAVASEGGSTDSQSTEELRFGVVSVESIAAPSGADGKWCRYVIDVPGGALSGVRQGSKEEVTQFAGEYAQQLCARTRFKTKVPYMRSQPK